MSQPLCGYEGILFLCYLGIFVGVGVFVFGFRPGGLALLGCRFAATATTATFFGGFAVVFGLLVVGDFECRGFDDGSGQQCRCCRGLGVGGAFVCFFLFGSCRKCRGDFGFRLRPRFRLRGRGPRLPQRPHRPSGARGRRKGGGGGPVPRQGVFRYPPA